MALSLDRVMKRCNALVVLKRSTGFMFAVSGSCGQTVAQFSAGVAQLALRRNNLEHDVEVPKCKWKTIGLLQVEAATRFGLVAGV